MLQLAFWLVASHAVCDYALQPAVMARGKNRHQAAVLPRDAKHEPSWIHWLSAHAMIHGAGVALALALVGRQDLWWLGLAEAASHAVIDYVKCDRRISMSADQVLHLACKLAWWWVAIGLLPAH
jgi:hypothetical protein